MRIVSWNMGNNSVRSTFHDMAWRHLVGSSPGLDADIALVQEAVPPVWLSEGHQIHWTKAWSTRTWGTGIVVRKGTAFAALERGVSGGRFVLGRLATERGEIMIASIHARTDVAEFMPPLVATFEAIRDACGSTTFIVGGDLNTARRADEFWPGYGHASFWNRLDNGGFHSCFWEQHGHEAVTYKHPTGPFIGQADHVLIDAVTAREAVVSSWVDDSHRELSDHRPLVVDLTWRTEDAS